jgi:FtsZ-interacting cell division protein YlmF
VDDLTPPRVGEGDAKRMVEFIRGGDGILEGAVEEVNISNKDAEIYNI